MKQIKLSGRERAVLRAIDFSTGSSGEELLERTQLAPEDLVDVLNGLMTVGYAEMRPYRRDHVVADGRPNDIRC